MSDLFPPSMSPLELRGYQHLTLSEICAALDSGARAPLVVLPTGSGKTTVAAALIQREIDAGGSALFMAPRRELVHQAVRRLRDAGISAGTVLAGADHLQRPNEPAQVASIDTLIARTRHGRTLELPGFTLVIVDEAHLAVTERRSALLDHWPTARCVGLTATPVRRDGRALGVVFDRLIAPVTTAQLQADGFLVPGRYWAPSTPDLRRVRITAGDFNARELDAAVNRAELVGDVVAHWLRLAADRRTVVFCASIPHSIAVAEAFQRTGVIAEHVDANTPTGEREMTFERFTRGQTQVLTNCFLASYGFDLPALSAVVLARPTRSLMLYLQMVGRGLRIAPDKHDCLVLDHAGCVHLHGFAHDPRAWTLEGLAIGATPARIGDRRECAEPRVLDCPECTAVFSRSLTCPECGYRFKPAARDVRAIDGDLVELSEHEPERIDREGFYREMRGVALERNYSPKWAAVTFRDRFGMWPPFAWNSGYAIEPSLATRRWVKSRAIAWAKSQRREVVSA